MGKEAGSILRSIAEIMKCNLFAKDGVFGKVNDIFLDDQNWTIRYLVVETSDWLPDRKLLIPFSELNQPDWLEGTFPMTMTRGQAMAKLVRGCVGKYTRFGENS